MHIQLVKLQKGLIASEWIHGVTLKLIGWQPTKERLSACHIKEAAKLVGPPAEMDRTVPSACCGVTSEIDIYAPQMLLHLLICADDVFAALKGKYVLNDSNLTDPEMDRYCLQGNQKRC